ncbi:MAG: preprotein translocase subunit SecA [Patescibacteria group bacterium]
MFKKLTGFFDPVKKLRKTAEQINALEPELEKLSDGELMGESEELKKILRSAQNDPSSHPERSEGSNNKLDQFLPRSFALVREAAKRTLGQRHFDVQLMGGIALHQGNIAEMVTGEGKTLAATAPVYLNALTGKGVHVITVNEYLAKRDTVWMGQIYRMLGLSVACLANDSAYLYDPNFTEENQKSDEERDLLGSFKVADEFLRPISRKEAYQADITYGTNHEFGFDYLRDNLTHSVEAQVQRSFHYAVIDEVDSVLVDEARTPLIISAPDAESSEYYKTFARIVAGLQKDADYEVDEKLKAVNITQEGIDKVEKKLGIKDLYSSENLRLSHYLQETLKAYGLFHRDKDYVVKNGEVIIVDQFTGRMLPGRRYSAGLHQAIEAKEGVWVQNESRTYAQITIQNYFRLYQKLAGMTGTAQTSAEEFHKVYNLEVISIPTNNPLIRKSLADEIYKTREGKYKALIKEVKKTSDAGRPVLVGTVSIDNNEEVSEALSRAGVEHEVLNAKNHEREGAIIAQAGRAGAVTVATNMAGRGVDIILSGNPPNAEEAEKIKELGGLHVIGTERHEARRIDNQLRGRAGRQGDPGSSKFFLSLDDDILRVFGGERIKNLMGRLDVPEDQPISAGLVSKAVEQAQSRIEGMHFDARKHLLEYDDVLNKQRLAIYKKRQELLTSSVQPQVLQVLDIFWMNHLENIEALMESVRIRAYGQHDPLVEFRREAHILYRQLLADFEQWQLENQKPLPAMPSAKRWQAGETRNQNEILTPPGHSDLPPGHSERSEESTKIQNSPPSVIPDAVGDQGFITKVGRNDPCPCGAKKSDNSSVKYKHCHGA